MSRALSPAGQEFRKARDFLLAQRDDPEGAYRQFRWPRPMYFNWALDWFDPMARGNHCTALQITGNGENHIVTFDQLARRSDQLAGWLSAHGVQRGEAILLLLDNRVELWESMLAAIKIGAVIVPTYTTATVDDLADRISRADIRHVIADSRLTARVAAVQGGAVTKIAVGPPAPGWLEYHDSHRHAPAFHPHGRTRGDDTLFFYFTSGTTSQPKIVRHTHLSYPVGHLSGMYWNGLRPGDLHLNISAPGWAKHAWSSFFVPWNAEATILALAPGADTPPDILDTLYRHPVTAFCAPPTVWRSLVAHGLPEPPAHLREATSAGEPLDSATFHAVRHAWGLEIRDGYGQTETTAQIGNPPGRLVTPGRMGLPLPGYRLAVLDPDTREPVSDGTVGELCIDLSDQPAGVMASYQGDKARTDAAFISGHYWTGDLVTRSADGYLTYVGRVDDMFKSFDHRISPLELEHALRSHPAVADVAVVPVPHPIGQWVPHAFLVPATGWRAEEATTRAVLAAAHARLPVEKHIHSVTFTDSLPKTLSGKIRRAELRNTATC
ncbi:AMP-binding protein [Streptosporangium sp. OZ121]|uniref:AMP-binding protein n=1 Tax=Streptosporangium sp. OZ121 TaxID=3444183 RepID=UPI003F7A1B65